MRFLQRLGHFSPYIIPLLLGALFGLFWFRSTFHSPFKPEAQTAGFVIEKGTNLTTISKKLEESGFVKHWWSVYYAARTGTAGDDGKFVIQAGEYILSASMTPVEILKKLLSGEINYQTLTVPPGTRMAELPALMAKTGLVIVPEADAALANKALLAKLEIPNSSFEGYIFPETYKFTRPVTADEMVERMVIEGKKRIPQEMYDRAIELGYSFPAMLSLASIIEKESGKGSELATISSVFHNRLRIQMPLQSDPTVIYCIPDFDGNITKEHLRTSCPWNTYINTGLPPTPICSPGMDAIKAALYPADTEFLYFVSKCDGTHHFSATYKEHKAAVESYQLSGACTKSSAASLATPE